MSASEQIDVYLAGLAERERDALQSLRDTIAAAAPDATEAISYGIPAFTLSGRPIAGFSAAKRHLSYFTMSPAVIDSLATELADWERSKGGIRFTPEHPLPATVVAELVRRRIAEIG